MAGWPAYVGRFPGVGGDCSPTRSSTKWCQGGDSAPISLHCFLLRIMQQISSHCTLEKCEKLTCLRLRLAGKFPALCSLSKSCLLLLQLVAIVAEQAPCWYARISVTLLVDCKTLHLQSWVCVTGTLRPVSVTAAVIALDPAGWSPPRSPRKRFSQSSFQTGNQTHPSRTCCRSAASPRGDHWAGTVQQLAPCYHPPHHSPNLQQLRKEEVVTTTFFLPSFWILVLISSRNV